MRTIVLFLIFYAFLKGQAQEWKLDQMVVFSPYSFHYIFKPTADSSYAIPNQNNAIGELKLAINDYECQPVSFSNIIIRGEGDSIIYQGLNSIDGIFILPILEGNYTITVAQLGFTLFEQQINITEKGLGLDIYLGDYSLSIYHIESKRLLSKSVKQKIATYIRLFKSNFEGIKEEFNNEIRVSIQL